MGPLSGSRSFHTVMLLGLLFKSIRYSFSRKTVLLHAVEGLFAYLRQWLLYSNTIK